MPHICGASAAKGCRVSHHPAGDHNPLTLLHQSCSLKQAMYLNPKSQTNPDGLTWGPAWRRPAVGAGVCGASGWDPASRAGRPAGFVAAPALDLGGIMIAYLVKLAPGSRRGQLLRFRPKYLLGSSEYRKFATPQVCNCFQHTRIYRPSCEK